jgi:hypothetical protein
MFAMIDLLWLAGGVALGVWLDRKYGDKIFAWYKTTEDQIGELNDKIKALKEKL